MWFCDICVNMLWTSLWVCASPVLTLKAFCFLLSSFCQLSSILQNGHPRYSFLLFNNLTNTVFNPLIISSRWNILQEYIYDNFILFILFLVIIQWVNCIITETFKIYFWFYFEPFFFNIAKHFSYIFQILNFFSILVN